jgi:hypothetical protein
MFVVVFDYMDCAGEVCGSEVAWSHTQIFAKKSDLNNFISYHKERSEDESGVYGLYSWAKVDEVQLDAGYCVFYAPGAPDHKVPFERLTRGNLDKAAEYVSVETRRYKEHMKREFGVNV